MNKPKMRGQGQPVQYSTWEWARAYLALILTSPIYLALWAISKLLPTLPGWVVRLLLASHDYTTNSRQPDIRIPGDPNIGAYMLRWWKIRRNWALNVYYHIVKRSDDDAALHDHPWWSFSIVLRGGYYEHRIADGGIHTKKWYGPGSVLFRPSGKQAHRLELESYKPIPQRYQVQPGEWIDTPTFGNEYPYGGEKPATTIFITGPVLRRWGFHHQTQWVDAYEWDSFCADRGIAKVNDVGNYGQQVAAKGQRTDV